MSFYFPNVDPIYLFQREGTTDSPYIPLQQTLTVNNGRVTLKEIPDYITKVTVKKSDETSLTEVTSDTPLPSQYRVDYSTGMVYFNSQQEGLALTFNYLGVGLVNIGANRLIIDTNDITGDAMTAQDLINQLQGGSASTIINDSSTTSINQTWSINKINTALSGKASTNTATTSTNGLLSSGDKTKLDGVANNANNYSHPTGDGNSHVPTTGTTNNGKVLKAGSTSNSAAWANVDWSEVINKPSTFTPPVASDSTLGGVKIGSGVNVDANGVISVSVGGSSAPNTKNLDDYISYSSSNTNWSPAFSQAFTDLGASGGIVQLGAKQYNISSTITIPSNVHIRGIKPGVTTIKLNSGSDVDMITLSNNQNCGINNLTIYGNCFDASPSSGKNGLVIGKAGLDVVSGTMNNIHIHDLYIRSIGGTGFYCFPNTWVYAISRVNIDFCTDYGAYIQSTDNEYDTMNITGNNKWGLYVTGSNNRFTSMKLIFNGRGAPSAGKYYGNGNDIASAGVYVTGKRNTFVNVESQENYGHGFVFDGALESDLMGLVSDKNGYTALAPDGTSVTGTPTATGYYFMNSAARITGMLKATNFSSSLKSQLSGYYIDSTCTSIALDYEQDVNIVGISANLSTTSIVSTGTRKAAVFANAQLNDFLQSGSVLTNKITAYDTNVFQLTSTNMMNAGYTISGSEITGQTAWGGTSPRMGTKSNLTTTQDRIYLARVKVKPSTDNYVLKLTAYWDEAPYNSASTAGSLTGTYKSGVYTDVSFVFKATRTSSALGLWLEDKGLNGTQGTFTGAEFSVIDITDFIMTYPPKTIDKAVSSKYFLGAKTFNDVGTPLILDSGATANRPLMPVVGRVFFDTTLGKPIYCKTGGSSPVWVDATGTTV